MASKIYVGNMSYNTTEDELRDLFANYGNVVSVAIITDRDTGSPKGFGFVEMETAQEAEAAINSLNGQEVGGRQLRVNEAMSKNDRDRPPRRNNYRY